MHQPTSLVPKILGLVLVFASIIVILFLLQYFGFIWHNAFFAWKYPTKGLDVSHHQGRIDWQKVAATSKYSFVYIKATEGHDFIDDEFATNWQQARANNLKTGAYHFFSMRSPGAEQADYFISVVPNEPDALPPAIDIEISATLNSETVRAEIRALSAKLEEKYGKKPVLYVVASTYQAYIKNHFDDHQLWFRSILTPPRIAEDQWQFWQFTNRGRVDGITHFVDINVQNKSL